MAGDTTTSAAGFFHQRFSDHLAKDTKYASEMLATIEAEAGEETAGGASLDVKWAHESYEGVGMAALAEGGDYATADPSKAVQPYLGLSHFSFAVDFTGHLEAQGATNKDGWVDAGSWRQKKANDLRMKRRSLLARFVMRDGSANWGQVAAVSGTTNGYITLTGVSIHCFRKGETLTIRDLITAGSEQLTGGAGSGLIVDIDYENSRIYMADVSGAAAADYIALSGFYDATVPNGIKNIVDADGTIQGMARGTVGNYMFQATEQVVTGALGPSDADILRDAVEDVTDSHTGGNYNTRWCANRQSRQAMAAATIGQNRFTDLGLEMGVPKMKINDRNGQKTVIEDRLFEFGELYACDFGKWVKAVPSGAKGGYPVRNGNSLFWPATAASGAGYADKRIMYWVERRNWGARDFRCQGKRTGWTAP